MLRWPMKLLMMQGQQVCKGALAAGLVPEVPILKPLHAVQIYSSGAKLCLFGCTLCDTVRWYTHYRQPGNRSSPSLASHEDRLCSWRNGSVYMSLRHVAAPCRLLYSVFVVAALHVVHESCMLYMRVYVLALQVQCRAMQQSQAACMVAVSSGTSMQQARLDHGDSLAACMAQHTDSNSDMIMSKQHSAMQPCTYWRMTYAALVSAVRSNCKHKKQLAGYNYLCW